MIKLYFFCLGIFISCLVTGQISGTKSIGASGNYSTLTAAFTDINLLGVSGPVVLELQSDYNTAVETYPVVPGILSGSSATNNIIIRPAIGVTGIIFSSSATPVWDLNGTKYMIIDGRPGGVGASQVTIRSTLVTGIAIRFRNDAAYNKLDYLTVESNNNLTNGIIQFSTSTGTIGNSFNTISNSDVRNRSDITGVPEVLIHNAGTGAAPNSSNTITGNNLFNANQREIFLLSAGLGNNWVITNNSFYYNAGTNISTNYAIQIYGGSGFTISSNYIGGQAPLTGGAPYTNGGFTTGNLHVLGMALLFGPGAVNTIENNIVRNISLTSLSGAMAGGIGVFSGSCNITGNYVGDITLAGTGLLLGIESDAAGIVKNNTITGLTKTNTGDVYGLIAANAAAITVDSNTIYNNTTTSTGDLYGILSEDAGATISNNIIKDMLQASVTPGAFYGISASGNRVINILRNRIYNVGATSASTGTNAVTGIYFGGAAGGSQACIIAGNQITLANGVTNNNQYQGINDAGLAGNNLFLFYNSVLIEGISNGSQNSFAFAKRDASNERHRNNIYYNNRAGGSGTNYAIAFVNNTGTISSDYNLLTGSFAAIALWGVTDYDFAAYKVNTAQDADSYSDQPVNVTTANLFVDPSVGDLNIKIANVESWYVNGKGIAGAVSGNINADFNGNIRGTTLGIPTDIGSHEFSTSTIPPDAAASAPPVPGGTTAFTFAGRKLGEIIWGTGGSVPSSIMWKYFSGVTPITQGHTINSYWNLDSPDGSGYSYDIKLYYTEAEQSNIPDHSLLNFKNDTGVWYIPATSAQSIDASGKYVITLGQQLTSLFNFTLGSSLVLPLNTITLSGLRRENNNILSWITAGEQNVQGFYIERSVDGRNFAAIGFVNSMGNGNSQQHYNFSDNNIGAGKTYYRLKQVGPDGRSILTNVVIIKGQLPPSFTIASVFPNPAIRMVNVMIEAPVKDNITLVVSDMSGKVMMTQKISIESGSNSVQLNVAGFARGIYAMKLTCPGNLQSRVITFVRQ